MDQEITTTAVCEAGRCHLCAGTIRSFTAANGRQCQHHCHQQDDAAIDQAKDLDRWAA
jgi:hypothetical protein